MSEQTEVLLLAELQQIRDDISELKKRLPDVNKVWLEPSEFAAVVGKSTKTLSNWRHQGKFRDTSIRRSGNTWLFHREHALADVDRGQT